MTELHDRIKRIAKDTLNDRYATADDQADAVAAAVITELGLTQFWAVAYVDGYQCEEAYEHREQADEMLSEYAAAVRNDEDAYVVTAWFTGWARDAG